MLTLERPEICSRLLFYFRIWHGLPEIPALTVSFLSFTGLPFAWGFSFPLDSRLNARAARDQKPAQLSQVTVVDGLSLFLAGFPLLPLDYPALRLFFAPSLASFRLPLLDSSTPRRLPIAIRTTFKEWTRAQDGWLSFLISRGGRCWGDDRQEAVNSDIR